MYDFLKKLFTDIRVIFIIGFVVGVGIEYYQGVKNVNKHYEQGYLEACKDFYKGKTNTVF